MTPKFDAFFEKVMSECRVLPDDLEAHVSAAGALKKLIVEVPTLDLLKEATRATVGQYTARRDSAHFNGDEYHGHCDTGGGYEVSWGMSGKRRHPNKFPAAIPNDARLAVAKVLKVDPSILEGFVTFDSESSQYVLLIECRHSNT